MAVTATSVEMKTEALTAAAAAKTTETEAVSAVDMKTEAVTAAAMVRD